jgi:hypothetical protein
MEMTTTRTNAILGAAASLSLCLSIVPCHAEHFVVAEARGVGHYRVGSSIDANAPIALRQGQHLELIAENGTTIELDGPYDDRPSSQAKGNASLFATLGAMFTEKNARTNESGTSRGQAIHELPQPWLVDVTHPGIGCLHSAAAPIFWRSDSARDATVVVQPDDRSWKASERWSKGSDRLVVQTEMPMRAGALYFVSLDGAEVAMKLIAIPDTLTNDQMRAAWMADKGCEAQARALIRTRDHS